MWSRHRPRLCVLRYLVGQQRLNAAIEKRKEWKREERAKWKALNAGVSEEKEDKTKEAKGEGLQAEKAGAESFAFPLAKGAGFALDMDLAILLLPTLKSLQTALRGKGGRAREWIPLDDPISFHIAVATLVAINSFIHVPI
eukprot:g761.t1